MKDFIHSLFTYCRSSSEEPDAFSRFFREASDAEKERVLGEVIRLSTEDQRKLIDTYSAQ